MKKIVISFITLFALFVVTSCDKDTTGGISRITYFPTFEVVGGTATDYVATGSDYTVPEATATEDGVELPVTTTVSSLIQGASSFDVNVADFYTITYTATNSDGYPGSTSKDVIVYTQGDFVNSIEGLYTSTVVRNGSASAQYTDMAYILIYKEGSDYVISDYIGGYYDLGRGYGYAYAATGPTITVNDIATSNVVINGNSFGVGAFGGIASITSFTIDAANKTILFTTDWDSGYVFEVTLVQVQP